MRRFAFESMEERRVLASLLPITDLANSQFVTRAISANGRTVVGSVPEFPITHAFRWTKVGGMQIDIAPLFSSSVAVGVSGNGSLAVGSFFGPPDEDSLLFMSSPLADWSDDVLLTIATPVGMSINGISANGHVAVGKLASLGGAPAFWRVPDGPDGAVSAIASLPGSNVVSGQAIASSYRGDVVVGHFQSGLLGTPLPFQWTAGSSTQSLGATGFVNAVSGDGLTAIGTVTRDLSGNGPPVRWKDGTRQALQGAASGRPNAISADGSIIVGTGLPTIFASPTAYVWKNESGGVPLHELLAQQGVDVSGWYLSEATGVSADGRTIVGNGRGPDGESAWIAELDAVVQETDLAVLSGRLSSVTEVEFEYSITGPANFYEFALFRSQDTDFDAADTLIAQPFAANPVIAPMVFEGRFTLESPLGHEPERPYLLVVADPRNSIHETSETNNTAAVLIEDRIDRWWATAGVDDEITVNFDVEIPSTGEWAFDIVVDGAFPADWKVLDALLISGPGLNAEVRPIVASNALLGSLRAGLHRITLRFEVPIEGVVERIEFNLKHLGEAGDIKVFEALFIADHPSVNLLTNPVLVEISGTVLDQAFADPQELAVLFQPILHFNQEERFQLPFSVEHTFPSNISVTGSRTQSFQLSPLSPPFGLGSGTFSDENVVSAVYASMLQRGSDGQREVAINYWFHYPISNWAEHGGDNSHGGDWEGITVFLDEIRKDVFEPRSVAFGQHVQVPFAEEGGQLLTWQQTVLTDGRRPNVYVGLGGHASYPRADTTRFDENTVEKHEGDGITFVPQDSELVYLKRAGDGAMKWQLYPGTWGNVNDGVPHPICGGNNGIQGPMFLNTFETCGLLPARYGERWIDPWDWADSFEPFKEEIAVLLSTNGVSERILGAGIGVISFSDADPGALRSLTVDDDRFEVVDRQLHLKPDQYLLRAQADKISIVITANDAGISDPVAENVFSIAVEANPFPWQNPVLRQDVNRDQKVLPTDVLASVSDLHRNGVRRLPEVAPGPNGPAFYLDVSGDGLSSPFDVVQILSYLTRGSGEGELDRTASVSVEVPEIVPLISAETRWTTIDTMHSQIHLWQPSASRERKSERAIQLVFFTRRSSVTSYMNT